MRLHHVAYVTKSVDQKASQLMSLMGFRPKGVPMIDEAQGVRYLFMYTSGSELVELLEPHGEKSPVLGHLKKGGGLNHVCYEVEDLDATLQRLRDTGEAMVVREPVPAPGIENRRVAFVVTTDRDLVEFVEEARK